METERKAELKRQEQERQGIEAEKQLFINNYKEISNSKIIQKALNDKVRNALDDGKGVEKVIHGIKFLEFDNVLYFAKGIITAYKIEAKIVKKLFGTKTMQEKIPYEVNAYYDFNNAKSLVAQHKKEILNKIKKIKSEGYFGKYPQGKNGEIAPIKWIVVEEKDNSLLLLSEKILDYVQYNEEKKDITWKNCTLRKWLNNEFYNKAFTSEEKELIKNANVENNAGGSTQDNVFLLSVEQANKLSESTRKCARTEYAKGKGLYANKDTGYFVNSTLNGVRAALIINA